jgi:hypothetical protein
MLMCKFENESQLRGNGIRQKANIVNMLALAGFLRG